VAPIASRRKPGRLTKLRYKHFSNMTGGSDV
jgi:hypothetical protein